MLPAESRLRHRDEFTSVMRRGRRTARGRLVVHVRRSGPGSAPRAGFVVSKTVGNAVVRHRVTRQLRHLVRARLAALPVGTMLVVRALPEAAGAGAADLGADLDAALRAALRKLGET